MQEVVPGVPEWRFRVRIKGESSTAGNSSNCWTLKLNRSLRYNITSHHLHQLGKIPKEGRWVPETGSEDSTRPCFCRFDSKGEIFCARSSRVMKNANPKRRKSRPTVDSKAQCPRKRVLLNIWWDMKGVLLDPGQTVTAKDYQQLIRWRKQKRPYTGSGE